MKRAYKARAHFNIECRECGVNVSTNSYRTLMCAPCRKSVEWKKNMLDYKWRLGKLVAAAKNRAKEKNLPFNLTKEYLISLWEGNNGVCAVSGRQLNLESWGERFQVNPDAPSVDRINPKLGYVEGNVRLVTYHINVALSEFGLESLLLLANDVTKHHTVLVSDNIKELNG